jgi:hypothetical protein
MDFRLYAQVAGPRLSPGSTRCAATTWPSNSRSQGHAMPDNVIRGLFPSGSPEREPQLGSQKTDAGWTTRELIEANLTITLGMYIKHFGYERTAQLLVSHLQKLESQIK